MVLYGVEAGSFVGVADEDVSVADAIDVDVEEARGGVRGRGGCCRDVLVVGVWGGRAALSRRWVSVKVGVLFEIL